MSHNMRHPEEDGQGLVEYALILMLVAIAVLATLVLFGEELQNYYQTDIIDELDGLITVIIYHL